MIQNYEKLMKKCFSLAKKGEGRVLANPMVGAVIVDVYGNVLSTGYHKGFGEAHAEKMAIESFKGDFDGKTLVVSLEPCSHYGKTPPCADLIVKSGIKTLVVAMEDPNHVVKGKGIKACKNAGIQVIEGVLEKQALELNEVFVKNQMKKTPFVAIKTATTLDGRVATGTGDSKWITNESSRRFVHKLRNRYDAILTSGDTVLADNPALTCRLKGGKNPVRVVVDTNLRTMPDLQVYKNDSTKVYIATIKPNSGKNFGPNIELIVCPEKNGHVDLRALTKKLYEKGICSVLVEAGGGLCGAFIKENLVDKLYHFTSPKILGDNSAISWVHGLNTTKIADAKKVSLSGVKRFGDDVLATYYFD